MASVARRQYTRSGGAMRRWSLTLCILMTMATPASAQGIRGLISELFIFGTGHCSSALNFRASSFISRFISSMMRCISRRICSISSRRISCSKIISSRRISCSTKESSRRLLSNFSGLKSWAWTGVKRRKPCKSRIPMKKVPTSTQGTVERPERLFKAVLCIASV